MQPSLPEAAKLTVNQSLSSISTKEAGTLNHRLALLEKGHKLTRKQAEMLGVNLQDLKDRDDETITVAATSGLLTIGRYVADNSMFEWLDAARGFVAEVRKFGRGTLGVQLGTLDADQQQAAVDAITSALLAADFRMPKFSSKPADFKPAFTTVKFFDLHEKVNLKQSIAAIEGTNLARWLATLPGNFLTPELYLKYTRQLAKEYGWQLEFLDEKKLAQKKAGAFLAVTQGSDSRDAGIVHLRYQPKTRQPKAGQTKSSKKSRPALALVGKGICFDTGGNNLKTGKSMFGMHGDMQGSAVALGTLLALTLLEVDYPVDCWLALAQNHIGPRAYKVNDIITASDGTTIEIVHTDAEGRMVLADTLAIASQAKPGLMLDFATLTGACVAALGTRYSGAFTNCEDLIPGLIAAGKSSGERVWPFPQDRDYDPLLKSTIADIKQCRHEGEADHILAGRFLSRFVKHDTPWVHIDLAASDNTGGLGHVPSEFTGFGVRFALEYLETWHGA